MLLLGLPFLAVGAGAGVAWLRHQFMRGCTHAGVVKGSTCPLCGRVV